MVVMESPLSSLSSEASTGYLQDAVTEWSDRCKRRKTTTATSTAVFCPKDFEFELPSHGFDDHLQVCIFMHSSSTSLLLLLLLNYYHLFNLINLLNVLTSRGFGILQHAIKKMIP